MRHVFDIDLVEVKSSLREPDRKPARSSVTCLYPAPLISFSTSVKCWNILGNSEVNISSLARVAVMSYSKLSESLILENLFSSLDSA